MNYVEHTFGFPFTDGSTREVAVMVAEGTGLGYSSQPSGGMCLWAIHSWTIVREPEGLTRYILIHLASGSNFPLCLYSEQHMRAWLELIAPLADWTLPIERLVKQPGYPTREELCELHRQAVGSVLCAVCGKLFLPRTSGCKPLYCSAACKQVAYRLRKGGVL